jgi:hypothetical protein
MKAAFNWASIVAFGVAAVLWVCSTRVKVSAKEALIPDGDGWTPAGAIDDDGSEFFATVKRQSRWSGWAAVATAIGVALQALSNALPA